MKKYIYDGATDKHLVRELTDDEILIKNQEIEITKIEMAKVKAEAEAKATAKAALLERLGITQDEANLLLS